MPTTAPDLHTPWITELRLLPDDARALMTAEAAARGMQAGLAWFENFCAQVQEPGSTPGFLLLQHDGRTRAVLPLLRREAADGQPRRLDSLGNYYTTFHAPALADDLAAQPLADALRAVVRQHRPASMRLAPMDPDSRTYALLQEALRAAGLHCHPYFAFGNWYLPSEGLDWDTYWKQRSSGLRSTCKRMGRKFEADGGTLEIVTGGDRLDSAIEAYHTVYASSWKPQEPYPGFMPGLVRMCAEHGWLRLGVARLNGQAVATQLWIVAGGRAEIYKVAYDEAHKAYSLGSLVTEMLMRHVLEHDRVREVDFLAGDEKYKQQWMTQRRERWGLVAYNPRTVAGALGAAREAAARQLKPLLARFRRPVADAATAKAVKTHTDGSIQGGDGAPPKELPDNPQRSEAPARALPPARGTR
ncbi:GNAT family N-acetyltransferase [Aquincola sp. J276]|uniref:GNAT family N-acetyltransferase n=1 Tax=Aquincola sp. J276 TaxID=2898432 RepID=UPI00215075B0|nr:GNAT family N-acetyltransferase [Aquincola sp. J276]MCR5866042.1 GNAT family N-acetyltransferase [Aquincola sp. J276]